MIWQLVVIAAEVCLFLLLSILAGVLFASAMSLGGYIVDSFKKERRQNPLS